MSTSSTSYCEVSRYDRSPIDWRIVPCQFPARAIFPNHFGPYGDDNGFEWRHDGGGGSYRNQYRDGRPTYGHVE